MTKLTTGNHNLIQKGQAHQSSTVLIYPIYSNIYIYEFSSLGSFFKRILINNLKPEHFIQPQCTAGIHILQNLNYLQYQKKKKHIDNTNAETLFIIHILISLPSVKLTRSTHIISLCLQDPQFTQQVILKLQYTRVFKKNRQFCISR